MTERALISARVTVLGCPIDNLSLEETLDRIGTFVRSGQPHQHVVVNVDKLIKLRADPGLRSIIEGCDLINADGQPIVWASRLLGVPLKERVAGIDLMEALIARASTKGWKVYFLGATRAVAEGVVARFQNLYPGLRVVGWRDGYWAPGEEAAVVEGVKRAAPDILFVAMSSPKKELFLHTNLRELAVPFAMGVGGAFDVVAGITRRAPRWIGRAGLEWLWRFLQEPRRLWRRYFWDDLVFFRLVLSEWFARRARRDRRSDSYTESE